MNSDKDEFKNKNKKFEKFEQQKVKTETRFSTQMDMFDFIKSRNLPILKDMKNQWFKQLWVSLTLKQIKHKRGTIVNIFLKIY